MSAARWERVTRIVEAIATAVSSRDSAALQAATVDLELAGPLRYKPLGSTPVVPPPRRLRLLRNHLVDRLGLGGVAEEQWSPPAPPPARTGGTAGTVRQELIVHVFARSTGPPAAAAYRRIRQMWDACAEAFTATEEIDGLGMPVSLPDVPGHGAVAARQNKAEGVQAIVRVEHDTVCLSVAAQRPGVTWTQWSDRWEAVAGDDGPLMAVVTIFAGLVGQRPDPSAGTVAAVAGALPATSDDFWQADGTALPNAALWELPSTGGTARHRRLVVLASADHDVELSALVWSRGDTELTPFTQYLLNAAKIRYEARERDASEPVLAGGGAEARRWLKDLSVTVEIARDNMSHSLRAAGLGGDPAAGPLGDDFALAGALHTQLAYDLRYVENAREATPSGSAVVSAPQLVPAAGALAVPTFGLVTALAEEFVAVNTLIDGSIPWPVANDRADYVRGTMPSTDPARPHEVVLTMLGEVGNNAAAHAVANLIRSFASVDQIVMVGIAAGVPAPDRPQQHVRLGDIVVGTWNVVDFDHIVDTPTGPQRRQEFPRRSALLAGRVKMLAAREMRGERPWETHLATLIAALPDFAPPPASADQLFAHDGEDAAPVPHPEPAASGHRAGYPKVHEGRIGSSDRSMHNATARDILAERHNLRAIEMEGKGIGAASFADGREWFVVRGISDYGDARVDKVWRRYASAVAAAYVRALLGACQPVDPHGGHIGGADAR